VTLDAGEDTLYALTEGSAGDTDELLVLNRYTGALTVTIPWVTRDAAMGSGAGYVMLGSVPAANRHAIGTKRPKARALHVYRTHNAAERSYGLAKRRGARSPPGWKDRGLPLEFFKTVTALDECRAFRVKLDPRAHKQAAVLVGASDTAVVLVYLDEGREEVIEVEALQTILSYTCVEPSERVAHIQVSCRTHS
jgi:hypothetical protein